MSHERPLSTTGSGLPAPDPGTQLDSSLTPEAHVVLWCVAGGSATTDDLVCRTSFGYDECVAVARTLEESGYVVAASNTEPIDLPRAWGSYERTVLELWVTAAGWTYLEAVAAHPLVEDWLLEYTFASTTVPDEISELDRSRTPPLFAGPNQ